MTSEEQFNLARFIQTYLEERIELMIRNAITQIQGLTIRDDDNLSLNFTVGLSGSQLKMILSGELDPYTAVKLYRPRLVPEDGHPIDLDKETAMTQNPHELRRKSEREEEEKNLRAELDANFTLMGGGQFLDEMNTGDQLWEWIIKNFEPKA